MVQGLPDCGVEDVFAKFVERLRTVVTKADNVETVILTITRKIIE